MLELGSGPGHVARARHPELTFQEANAEELPHGPLFGSAYQGGG